MSSDAYIFEIPVYRVSEDDWLDDLAARVADWSDHWLNRNYRELGVEPDKDKVDEARMLASAYERRAGWRYNEVIAWIGLRWDGPGPVVKAYGWVVGRLGDDEPRSRYQRGFVPYPFVWGDPVNKLFEVGFHEPATDTEIYEQLRHELLALRTEKVNWLRRRYIDMRCFETIGPHIRWCELMGLIRRPERDQY